MHLSSSRRGPVAALVALVVLLLVGTAGPATAASPVVERNPSGFVRVGHLAPLVGPVDVVLVLPSGREQLVVEKARYGAITGYETLPPGSYTLQMRTVGAAAGAAPLLSAAIDVAAGTAYTVLATGTPDALVTTVVDDDLAPPPASSARVRLLQGSTRAQSLTVDAVGGPTLARDVQYGTATGYGDVPQGRWTLRVTAAGSPAPAAPAPVVDLAAGTVNSLVVTDTADGGFAVTPVLDASGIDAAFAPAGGVETGGGGTAPAGSGIPRPAAPALGGLALLAVTLLAIGVLRRAASPRSGNNGAALVDP